MPDNDELLLQIAAMHQAAKQPAKAIATYDLVLATDADQRRRLSRPGRLLSQPRQAGRRDRPTTRRPWSNEPKNSGVLNNLAWVLATSPDDNLRDGKRAIELAKQACEVTEYKQAHILSTLAAGYAEIGRLRLGHRPGRRRRSSSAPTSSRGSSKGARKLPGPQAVARSGAADQVPEPQAAADERVGADPTTRRPGRSVGVSALDRQAGLGTGLRVHGQRQPAQAHAGGRSGHASLCPRIGEPTKTPGASSACCTTSTTSAGPTRPTIRCKARPSWPSAAIPQHVIYAIKSHADYLTDCPRVSPLDKALYACDELAGLHHGRGQGAARGHSRAEGHEREKEAQAKELCRRGQSRRHHARAPPTWASSSTSTSSSSSTPWMPIAAELGLHGGGAGPIVTSHLIWPVKRLPYSRKALLPLCTLRFAIRLEPACSAYAEQCRLWCVFTDYRYIDVPTSGFERSVPMKTDLKLGHLEPGVQGQPVSVLRAICEPTRRSIRSRCRTSRRPGW